MLINTTALRVLATAMSVFCALLLLAGSSSSTNDAGGVHAQSSYNSAATAAALSSSVPRIILVSINTGGGVGSMFASLSRLCYAQASDNYHSVTYTMDDVVSFIPSASNDLKPGNAGPCYGNYASSFNNHFGRVYALRRAIHDFAATDKDWLVWMENEIFVARPTLKLHELLPLADEKRHLIVASDSKLGVSSKLFALRASQWGKQFLDSWYEEQKSTLDCPRAEGAMMMAIMRQLETHGTLSNSKGDDVLEKCGAQQQHRNGPRDKEYWKQDHKTPLVRCFASVVASKSSSSSGTTTTCPAGEVRTNEFSTMPLPGGGDERNNNNVRVTSSCALSEAVFATKRWDAGKTWLRFGTFDDHARDAVSLGTRFVPRCF